MGNITGQELLAAIGIGGTVFTIYKNFFSTPTEKTATEQAVVEERITGIVNLFNERFVQMGTRLDKVFTNDLPHIDQQLVTIREVASKSHEALVELRTMINERIPRNPNQ